MDNVRDEVGKLIDVIVRAMFEGESMKCLKKAIQEVKENGLFELDSIRVISSLDGEYYGAIIHILAGGYPFDDVTIKTIEKSVVWDIRGKNGDCVLMFDERAIIDTWVENQRRIKTALTCI